MYYVLYRDFSRKQIQGGQIESFKNRGGQSLNQVEFSRAVNEEHLSTDIKIIFI